MAFSNGFYQPSSYADLYFNSPYGYAPRRPSPPPSTYYSYNPYGRYAEEVAREQAARAALQKAVHQERMRRAMAARAEEERRRQAIEQARRQREARMRAQQQQRHRPQTWFGVPLSMFADDEDDIEYGCPALQRTKRPAENLQTTSPQPTMSDAPAQDMERMEEAATTIQNAFRRHAALKRISSNRERFTALKDAFSIPSHLTFEPESYTEELARDKLAYGKENAPVHAFIDSSEKMLQDLDSIESGGVEEVRDARRQLVLDIEATLRGVEEGVKEAWRAQQPTTSTEVPPAATSEEGGITIPAVAIEAASPLDHPSTSDTASDVEVMAIVEESVAAEGTASNIATDIPLEEMADDAQTNGEEPSPSEADAEMETVDDHADAVRGTAEDARTSDTEADRDFVIV